jgi:hypothetical protein
MLKECSCAQCGRSYTAKDFPSRPAKKFCSRDCELAWRATDQTMKTHARRGLEAAHRSPALQDYLMSARNPFRGPGAEVIRTRGHAVQAAAGWPTLTGGNGTGLTTPQELLLRQLGEEFTPEYSIGLKKEPGYPKKYSADLACSRLKLIIELDGHSHWGKPRQELDRKRDTKLASLGWTTLRFQNETVLTDLSGTLKQVRETMSRLES